MKKGIVLLLAVALIVPLAMTGCMKSDEKKAEEAAAKALADAAAACPDEACKKAGKCSHVEAAQEASKGEHPEHPTK